MGNMKRSNATSCMRLKASLFSALSLAENKDKYSAGGDTAQNLVVQTLM